MGKGYSGAWKNVTEVDVNKDNISDIEELLHTVNKSDVEDISTYAASSKSFGAVGVGYDVTSEASNAYNGGGHINGVSVKINSTGRTNIYNWVKGLSNTYDSATLARFKTWLSDLEIDAGCVSSSNQAGWHDKNDYAWYITGKADYDTSTKKLTVTLTADGNTYQTDNYQHLQGDDSFTGAAGSCTITINKRMTNQDWCSRWYRISMTAQFSLYNSKGTKIKTISLKNSDTDVTAKTAKITGLDPGKYTLKETYACRGCVINETTYPITLSKTNPNWSPSKSTEKGVPLLRSGSI